MKSIKEFAKGVRQREAKRKALLSQTTEDTNGSRDIRDSIEKQEDSEEEDSLYLPNRKFQKVNFGG